ncbi:MAG: Enterobactin exporter EntS [Anaerolineales bacterium]|nr:MFS transporter [Anaerolineae bacterium]MBL8106882.1 MFS transporter [Anaerolineales bacterium]MBV6400018.1 Enterobactin exporter EntS [Anaerolineales bacterium]MCC7188882.1 MFS transporter [Anaerolineales bacterium]
MFYLPPALTHRKFFYLWLGLLISVAGSQMQFAAIHWHVRELTGEPNPLALGGIGLARILPVFIFSILGGAVADNYNRRKILLLTQSIAALQAAALAYLTITNQITVWHIYLLTAIQAATMAFDLPARQAMVPNLVSREHLPSAFSMSSVAFNTGAIVGPLLFGVIPEGGQGFAYLFNSISFLAVILALFFMGNVQQDLNRAGGVNVRSMWDGVKFIFTRPLILSTMMMDFVATFFASANTMLPIVARDILFVGKAGYAWLVSSQAIGSVVAGIIVSQIKELRKQGPLFLTAVTLFGLATVWFGLSRTFIPAMVALLFIGVGDAVSTVIRNTIRQLQTPDHIRGRMTSVNQIFFMGGPQLGEVEAGVAASLFGVPFAIVSGGIGCIVGMLLIIWKWPQLISYNGNEPTLATAPAD